MKNVLLMVLFVFCLVACNKTDRKLSNYNENEITISYVRQIVDKNYLGSIEGIRVKDSLLVTMDYRDGMSYSLFDAYSGDSLMRFGEIGHGNKEIPTGCDIAICNDTLLAFDDDSHLTAAFCVKAESGIRASDVSNYHVEDAQLSKLLVTNNGLLLGKGTFNDKFQYVLFERNGKVVDYAFNIYNADNAGFNSYQKFLSNQGQFAKHPSKDLYVGTTDYSLNINFFAIEGDKIREIKSITEENPRFTTHSIGGLSQVIPTEDAITGFLDIATTDSFVYALYSDERFKKEQYCSNTIMVFDWDGNIMGKINTHNKVFYIAANSDYLYTVEKDEDGCYLIIAYSVSI